MSDINVFHEKDGIRYLSFEPLDRINVINAFSTRIGGNSSEPFAALNMGLHTGDDAERVLLNRKLFFKALNLDINSGVCSRQIHGTKVEVVNYSHKGKGINILENALEDTDGMVTNCSGIALVTFYADCVPLYIFDKRKKVIGLSHAGWKGTAKKIANNTIEKMNAEFKSDPTDCFVIIGPSIGPCCYEVDERVIQEFLSDFDYQNISKPSRPGHYMLNLWEANRLSFVNTGVPSENIYISSLCTSCNTHLFYSHRAEKGKTGRMAAIIALK